MARKSVNKLSPSETRAGTRSAHTSQGYVMPNISRKQEQPKSMPTTQQPTR